MELRSFGNFIFILSSFWLLLNSGGEVLHRSSVPHANPICSTRFHEDYLIVHSLKRVSIWLWRCRTKFLDLDIDEVWRGGGNGEWGWVDGTDFTSWITLMFTVEFW